MVRGFKLLISYKSKITNSPAYVYMYNWIVEFLQYKLSLNSEKICLFS